MRVTSLNVVVETSARSSVKMSSSVDVNTLYLPEAHNQTMPNGRTGGFIIDLDDLKQVVKSASETTVVGHILNQSQSSRPRPTVAAEAARFVDECKCQLIAVEEQHRNSYIIHLSREPLIWLVVGPEHPLFAVLRQRHGQWMTKHPGWKGWFGF
jgi:hypothetical protein